jgi:hypothetical protein
MIGSTDAVHESALDTSKCIFVDSSDVYYLGVVINKSISTNNRTKIEIISTVGLSTGKEKLFE